MRGRLLVLLLVGCYDPEVPLGVPCSDTGDCPAGQQCDAITNTCTAPTDLQVWLDDTAADFAQPGAVLTDATVETLGAIGPAPYATGRFKLTGIAADMISDPATASWDAIAAAPITGVAYTPRLDISYSDQIPGGLGLTMGDNITVTVEGEIYLDTTGMWIFELDANDKGFVDIAAPGGDFVRVTTSMNAPTTGMYFVTTPGWHHVRAAFADAAMYMDFHLRVDSPNVPGGPRDVKTDQMRVRVDDVTGWAIDGFADGLLVDYTGSTLQQDPIDGSYEADPFGILLGGGAWSMRWSGQVRFDATGDYVFQIASVRGHRVWIDGNLVADAFVNTDQQTTTAPIHLDEGWHDVVIDLTKSGTAVTFPSMLSVKVMDGPAWVGQTIPTDHVRPVIGRQVRWASDENGTDVAIPDGASATKPLFLDMPANAMPMTIQSGWEIDHPAQGQVSIVLDPPAGANLTFLAFGALTGMGVHYSYNAVPTADAGSVWTFIAADNAVDTVVGNLTFGGVTIVLSGGIAPFPTAWRYESAVRDLGNVTRFGTLRYKVLRADVTTAVVSMRTCDTADACVSEAWTEIPNETTPDVPVRRFAQYAVSMTGDGDVARELDVFELTYATAK